MKTTGIIRRIDDLGRVIIPKEIRKTFNIEEGEPLEIYISDDLICFKKHKNEIVSGMYVIDTINETDYHKDITNIIEILSRDYTVESYKKTEVTKKLIEAIEILN